MPMSEGDVNAESRCWLLLLLLLLVVVVVRKRVNNCTSTRYGWQTVKRVE